MSEFISFPEWLASHTQRSEQALDALLDAEATIPTRLHQAMRYAAQGGGKRIRPLLVYAAGELGDASPATLDAAATAIECIHAYSLVHDDLPCMDDDDLRRGRPTVHKAFDEATALLVGDALQTRAFEILALADCSAEVRLSMISVLAAASGSRGMAGGQAIDLENVGKKLDLSGLQQMHAMKTGALLSCAVQMGGIASHLSQAQMMHLQNYSQKLGLAFQIIDDVLDVTSDSQTLGKTAGKDAAQDKPTYVSLMGLDYARKQAQELQVEAIVSLASFGSKALALKELALLMVNRGK
ncbi:polyprenyl synthetase family protein [Polynucleobacter paneuropaeus]|uniref:polyprenyl synthetase family protein n=1 Tax=Polynucleobacter paneuropaeus TaxID=2527775 RepID=UPI001BFE3859|nr:farnesyl diphosphate synthase [Polynucleobacter paneuropaeus]MBT8635520.1 polyprenyl synthetase family protein [Polynucleobacter paneuropaeus]QWD52170.1 polyprenyl synthetase family protein [Polynucleobacter paneuropaeus]QWD55487.1 polyprenyl synthetase family protein [Polynucleobacter paneuropaeus]QWD57089.1 polyprenyl synthetase family protein [Polynucleobacter paneuropaeus]